MQEKDSILADILVILLYVIECGILLPFLDSGLNALNQASTISFVSGIIWCCFIIAIFGYIIKTNLNRRIVWKIINYLNF